MDREQLGQIVRAEWVRFAQEQPNPKPSHLVPWQQLDEANKEVDRRIGEAVATAVRAEMSEVLHEKQRRGQYHDGDIVGYWIRSAYFDPKTQDLMGTDQVVCADCWERYISHGSFVVKRPVTFAETAEQELVCSSFCHLQLPTRGEP